MSPVSYKKKKKNSKSLKTTLPLVEVSEGIEEVTEPEKDEIPTSRVDDRTADSNSFLTMIESSDENVKVIPEPIHSVAKLSYEAEREFKRISAVVEELQLQETLSIPKIPSQKSSDKKQEDSVQECDAIVQEPESSRQPAQESLDRSIESPRL